MSAWRMGHWAWHGTSCMKWWASWDANQLGMAPRMLHYMREWDLLSYLVWACECTRQPGNIQLAAVLPTALLLLTCLPSCRGALLRVTLLAAGFLVGEHHTDGQPDAHACPCMPQPSCKCAARPPPCIRPAACPPHERHERPCVCSHGYAPCITPPLTPLPSLCPHPRALWVQCARDLPRNRRRRQVVDRRPR